MTGRSVVTILKWTAIGLFIRLAIMPFTMHGQDILFVNYFPMLFAENGTWDVYGLISSNLTNFPYTYYGPVIFIIMTIADFIIIKLLNPENFVHMLELARPLFFQQFTAADYTRVFLENFSKIDLFKNIFLLKSPYLVFDFMIAGALLKLADSEKTAIATYKIWMLNIVVLYSAYAVGGFDVITAFFIVSALLAAVRKRPYLCVILLSLGGATKLYPYVLILPACLLLGDNWKKNLLLIFTAAVTGILIYLPFYLSSGPAVFDFFLLSEAVHYSGAARWALSGTFLALYIYLAVKAKEDSRKPDAEKKLLYYFLVALFLSYTAVPIRFRYFLSATPLLALLIPGNKKIGIFSISLVLMLAFLWLTERTLQMGLLAPLGPDYFPSLPTLQEVIGRFVDIEMIYKITARVLLAGFFAGAWWIWSVKTKNESLILQNHRSAS